MGIDTLLLAVKVEVERARRKFPEPDGLLCALTEETGEVARALTDQPWYEVYSECIQTAAMALRIALEGDPTLAKIRALRTGCPMGPPKPVKE